MVGRLAQRFDFLKGSRRDPPDRQRTLRSTLEAAAEVCVSEDGLAAMWYGSLSGVRLPPAAESDNDPN